ncbi:uncharacterized protein LOC110847704 [Folsomia candida]|uniref:uncharacterized protein LOC110847704 n=1 Tax=Folsomia candida TaxID=158441 RepID=UPI000B8FB661|nr:uncharacterized protein LOC110847704 [Folsomia candida]
MIYQRSFVIICAMTIILPHLICGQNNNNYQMSYSIVNGKLYVDPPTTTTTAPSFMENWFPWLSSSYTSSNPEEVDEAIINSVTGPPQPSISLSQNSPSSYSQYQYNQQQPQASYADSPYLSNDEDNYLPADSVNTPQQVAPPPNGVRYSHQSGYPNPNYISNPYKNSAMPQLPYPFSPLPGQTTTSAPFYQPILDFFGYGSSNEEDQLQLPFPGGQYSSSGSGGYSSLPSSFPQNSFNFIPPQFAQARKSDEEHPQYVDTYGDGEAKYSSYNGPKSAKSDDVTNHKKNTTEKENPCPKLGNWQWNGDVCIAVGPVPIWACKPNDLVMSGRIGVCRNKIFFHPGTNPLGNK